MTSHGSLLSIVFLALILVPARSSARPRQETLTLPRAIEIAMKQQPSVRQAQATIEGANARVDQAKVARRPTISLSASLDGGSTQVRAITSSTGQTTGGFLDPDAGFGVSASLSWRIFDFGQTRANIRAAEASAEATGVSIRTTTLDIEANVSIAFLEAVARQRLIAVADATVESEELHLEQARRFVAAQAKDPIEVAQAQARAANARSALAQAQSNAAVALANLRNAIGWLDPQVTFAVDPAWPTPPTSDPGALDVLVTEGRKHRPEILQIDREVIAAEASLTAAEYSRRPVLSANASTQWNPDTNDATPQPAWGVGLSLTWQLYDGGRASADIRAARASLAGVQAQRDALLVALTAELDAARSRIVANRANVAASTEAVFAARAQLELADARYTQGLGSQIELADAQTAITTAEGNLISAEWQLADAWTQLRRALGDV